MPPTPPIHSISPQSCSKIARLAFVFLVHLLGNLTASTGFAEDTNPASLDPNQLVLRAVQQAVWGPSVHCRIRQSSAMDEYRLIGEGQYWGAGQGSGQLKLTMQLSAGDVHTNLVQVSDGRLVWTSAGDDEPPRRVYLDRIRAGLGSAARNPDGHPDAALYLAIGGHAEMLRYLYLRYRWFKVWAGKDERGNSVWQLVGTIRSEAPSQRSHSITDNHLVQPPISDIPTDVRLTLDRDGKVPFFPYKIEYYKRESSVLGQPGKLIPVSSIINDDLVSPITITKDLFEYQVREDADQIDDETSEYVPFFPMADSGQHNRK